MQDLSNQNAKQTAAFRPSNHRRAHSEVNFRMPDDLDLVSDPYGAHAGTSFEEIGSEDDLFSTYMDIENLAGSSFQDGVLDNRIDNARGGCVVAESVDVEKTARPRHRHSNSVDSSSLFGESIETKKAMDPDKLAELWTMDPKRAKRILANRQSAARSKERKARYISELERKVQTLQTEATTLSAQLTLFQRDTTGLSNENTELKIRLQAMEQQAQLCDALNDALKQEVERLRMATSEMASPSDTFNLGMQHVPYPQSSFFSHHQPQGRGGGLVSEPHQTSPMPPQYHQPLLPANNSMTTRTQAFSDMMQQQQHDPLGRFQGLDISSRRSPHLVKSEGASISASESSSTF